MIRLILLYNCTSSNFAVQLQHPLGIYQTIEDRLARSYHIAFVQLELLRLLTVVFLRVFLETPSVILIQTLPNLMLFFFFVGDDSALHIFGSEGWQFNFIYMLFGYICFCFLILDAYCLLRQNTLLSIGVSVSILTFPLVVVQLRTVSLTGLLIIGRVIVAPAEGSSSDIVIPRRAVIGITLTMQRPAVVNSLLQQIIVEIHNYY